MSGGTKEEAGWGGAGGSYRQLDRAPESQRHRGDLEGVLWTGRETHRVGTRVWRAVLEHGNVMSRDPHHVNPSREQKIVWGGCVSELPKVGTMPARLTFLLSLPGLQESWI